MCIRDRANLARIRRSGLADRLAGTRDTLGDALVELIREKPFDEITAVSYTHLDVYKRQITQP